jgi:hypothetical protein
MVWGVRVRIRAPGVRDACLLDERGVRILGQRRDVAEDVAELDQLVAVDVEMVGIDAAVGRVCHPLSHSCQAYRHSLVYLRI